MAVAPTQDVKAYKNYIGGEWVEAASGETFDVINPSSGGWWRPYQVGRETRSSIGLRARRSTPGLAGIYPTSAYASCLGGGQFTSTRTSSPLESLKRV